MTTAEIALAYAAVAGATFVAYGWDKLQARRGGRRVPEARLHGLTLLGGFAGAWLGMLLFRHKTRKPAFLAVIAAATVLHVAGWTWWMVG